VCPRYIYNKCVSTRKKVCIHYTCTYINENNYTSIYINENTHASIMYVYIWMRTNMQPLDINDNKHASIIYVYICKIFVYICKCIYTLCMHIYIYVCVYLPLCSREDIFSFFLNRVRIFFPFWERETAKERARARARARANQTDR